jgi:hypothetical protein
MWEVLLSTSAAGGSRGATSTAGGEVFVWVVRFLRVQSEAAEVLRVQREVLLIRVGGRGATIAARCATSAVGGAAN